MMDQEDRKTHASVSLREITWETVWPICKLSNTLSEVQQHMVAPNAVSIAQAHYNPLLRERAIYADETPVGFMMLYDSPEEKTYFLWRLMVGAPYQGMGFGRQAVKLLIDYVKSRPDATELLVSCEQGDGSPEGFYRRLGFERNGKMYDDEVGLSLPL